MKVALWLANALVWIITIAAGAWALWAHYTLIADLVTNFEWGKLIRVVASLIVLLELLYYFELRRLRKTRNQWQKYLTEHGGNRGQQVDKEQSLWVIHSQLAMPSWFVITMVAIISL